MSVFAAALLAGVILLPGGHAPVPRLRTFGAGAAFAGITFRYPATWRVYRFNELSMSFVVLADLSDRRLQPPYRYARFPAVDLRPAGVFAQWSAHGSDVWSFDRSARGEPTTVDGRRARVLVSSEEWCSGRGGAVTMTVYVERADAPGNWFELDASFAEPDVAASEAQVGAMIASTHFGAGS